MFARATHLAVFSCVVPKDMSDDDDDDDDNNNNNNNNNISYLNSAVLFYFVTRYSYCQLQNQN